MTSRVLSARGAIPTILRCANLGQPNVPTRTISTHSNQVAPTHFVPRVQFNNTFTTPWSFNVTCNIDSQGDAPRVNALKTCRGPDATTPVGQTWKEQSQGLTVAMLPDASCIEEGIHASSTLKKRRLKMNRHKYRKRRKRDRRKSK